MLKNFGKISVLVVLTEKYYILIIYQYKRMTRRLILSTVSEQLSCQSARPYCIFWYRRFLLQRVQPFFEWTVGRVSPPLLYPMYMYMYMVPKPLII